MDPVIHLKKPKNNDNIRPFERKKRFSLGDVAYAQGKSTMTNVRKIKNKIIHTLILEYLPPPSSRPVHLERKDGVGG